MTYIPSELRKLVFDRAAGRCEYCLIHNDDTYQPHEVDHITAEKHDGQTVAENLCLSCFVCNRHKGSDLASFDPETGELTRLHHPRTDRWDENFRLDGDHILGVTAVGRVTVKLPHMNDRVRLLERAALIELGRYDIPDASY